MALGVVPAQLCMLAASTLRPVTHLLHMDLLLYRSVALYNTDAGIYECMLKSANGESRPAPAYCAVKDPSALEAWAWREPVQPAAMLH